MLYYLALNFQEYHLFLYLILFLIDHTLNMKIDLTVVPKVFYLFANPTNSNVILQLYMVYYLYKTDYLV